jgi:hypothetical protein
VIDQNNLPLMAELMKKAISLLLAHLVGIRAHDKAFSPRQKFGPLGEQKEKTGQ